MLSLSLQPNPSAEGVTVTYALPRSSGVLLRLFDVQGREVARSSESRQAPGIYRKLWEPRADNGARLPSGSYYLRLDASPDHKTARWVVVR